jgi:hypothetical protein
MGPTLAANDCEVEETGFDDGMEALRFARDQQASGLKVAIVCTETSEVSRGDDIKRFFSAPTEADLKPRPKSRRHDLRCGERRWARLEAEENHVGTRFMSGPHR